MKMTHEKEEVLKALEYLDGFSNLKEYKENLVIIYDYMDDLVKMTSQAQEAARKAVTTLLKTVEGKNEKGKAKIQLAGSQGQTKASKELH